MNKPSIKDFAKELTLTDMQGKDISKIQDIDYEAYCLALETYIAKLEKAFDRACTKLEGLCTVIDILTDKDTAHDKQYWKEELMKDVH